MRVASSLLIGALCAIATIVHSAEPRWPTEQDIDRLKTERPLPAIPLGKATGGSALPRISPQKPLLDIESLVRRHEGERAAFDGTSAEGPSLKIFVTLAMPRASLERLTEQAARAHAAIVIRGLHGNSMRATLEALKPVIGERTISWQIDPPAFARYEIKRAPTFVLTADSSAAAPSSCGNHCTSAGTFVSVSGDVTLAYALAYIERTVPAFASQAHHYLERLKP